MSGCPGSKSGAYRAMHGSMPGRTPLLLTRLVSAGAGLLALSRIDGDTGAEMTEAASPLRSPPCAGGAAFLSIRHIARRGQRMGSLPRPPLAGGSAPIRLADGRAESTRGNTDTGHARLRGCISSAQRRRRSTGADLTGLWSFHGAETALTMDARALASVMHPGRRSRSETSC